MAPCAIPECSWWLEHPSKWLPLSISPPLPKHKSNQVPLFFAQHYVVTLPLLRVSRQKLHPLLSSSVNCPDLEDSSPRCCCFSFHVAVVPGFSVSSECALRAITHWHMLLFPSSMLCLLLCEETFPLFCWLRSLVMSRWGIRLCGTRSGKGQKISREIGCMCKWVLLILVLCKEFQSYTLEQDQIWDWWCYFNDLYGREWFSPTSLSLPIYIPITY